MKLFLFVIVLFLLRFIFLVSELLLFIGVTQDEKKDDAVPGGG